MPKPVSEAFSAFISSLIHSFLVIGSMYVFLNGQMTSAMNGMGYLALLAILMPGAAKESVVAAVVCAAVVSSLTVIKGRRSKLSEEIEKDMEG